MFSTIEWLPSSSVPADLVSPRTLYKSEVHIEGNKTIGSQVLPTQPWGMKNEVEVEKGRLLVLPTKKKNEHVLKGS